MSEQSPQNNESKEEEKEKEISQENKENKEEIKEEIKEEKNEDNQEAKEDKKENINENEEEKSEEEEKEKSESSKGSESESEESKESKKSKKEKSEENEENDEDDDDLDDDDDNEGISEESSDSDKQKDPYHGYLNSKTGYKTFFSDICTKDFIYGYKQNKFYKIVNLKNLSGDKKAQIYRYELKEIKSENNINQKPNIKLKKNIQYMASIYGKATEDVINVKEENNIDQDIKESENKDSENKSINKDDNNAKIDSEIKSNEKIEEKEDKDISDKKEETKTEENKEVKIEENKEIPKEENKEVKKEEKIKEKEEQNASKKTNKDSEDKTKEKDKNNEKKSKTKTKNKPKNSNLEVIIKDLTEYTFFQKIRVVYLNSLNNPEVFYLKININTTIKEILDQFASLYHYKLDRYSDKIPVCIFINGKMHSVSNRTRSKYFIPTKFDYKNDYILILEKQTTKLKEYDLSTYNNQINLRGVTIPHVVYNSLYNFEVDSFIISKNLTFLDCQIYELKKDINLRQFTDNERTIKQKLKDFLDLNWKERCTFVTTFKSVKAKKSNDNYRANLFELNRKFILLQGKMYIFLIKSSNQKIYTFYGKNISTDGIYIVSRNDKSLINGFRAKAISDFKAYS